MNEVERRRRHLICNRAWNARNPGRKTELARIWKNNNPRKYKQIAENWKAANPGRKSELTRCWKIRNIKECQKRDRRVLRQKPWSILLSGAKRRAKVKNIPWGLSSKWAKSTWTGKCALTDLSFVARPSGKRRGARGISMLAASLDRISPKRGYVPGNCRFIVAGLNFFKHTGTDFEMLKISRALVAKMDGPKAGYSNRE